jgi:hypothetical protein
MRYPKVNDKVKPAPQEALDAMFAGIGQLIAFTDRLRVRPTAQPVSHADTADDAPALREELAAADEQRTERMLKARNEAVADGLEPQVADEVVGEFVRRHPPQRR